MLCKPTNVRKIDFWRGQRVGEKWPPLKAPLSLPLEPLTRCQHNRKDKTVYTAYIMPESEFFTGTNEKSENMVQLILRENIRIFSSPYFQAPSSVF